MIEGYLHPLYAQSFSNIGSPIYLPKSKGWLIKRRIPGTDHFDAMGPYPLFFCENWENLTDDFSTLKNDLVSISVVVEPLSAPALPQLKLAFDFVDDYKTHYLLDLSKPLLSAISKNTRKNARRALRNLSVESDIAPNIDIDEWVQLYKCLIEHHHINDLRKFSRQAFEKQIAIPKTHFFKVLYQDSIVNGLLFYLQNGVAYSHLSASTPKGYKLSASYAAKWTAINSLSEKVKFINFGGGQSSNKTELSGLDLFKEGWSNQTGQSYFCGSVLNVDKYAKITAMKGKLNSTWFPAYREGEFS